MELKLKNTLFVAFIMVFAIALCGCNADTGNKTEATEAEQSATASQAIPAIKTGGNVGDMAPEFKLADIEGGTLALSSLRGNLVLVDFWDTWCPPCRKALPHLQELDVEYGDDMIVVGIAFARYGKEKVREYVKSNNFTFKTVIGGIEVAKAFGDVQSIPTTFLINSEGKIVKKWVGPQSKEEYGKLIRQELGL